MSTYPESTVNPVVVHTRPASEPVTPEDGAAVNAQLAESSVIPRYTAIVVVAFVSNGELPSNAAGQVHESFVRLATTRLFFVYVALTSSDCNVPLNARILSVVLSVIVSVV